MRVIIVAVSLFMLSLTTLAAAEKPALSCLDKCEKQKKECFAQYTKSDSTSGTYVTPDGHRICWRAFHECKKQCPQSSR